MARLFKSKWNENDELVNVQNFDMRYDEDGFPSRVYWEEDLDLISIDKEELRILAEALGYHLVKKGESV